MHTHTQTRTNTHAHTYTHIHTHSHIHTQTIKPTLITSSFAHSPLEGASHHHPLLAYHMVHFYERGGAAAAFPLVPQLDCFFAVVRNRV
mmetsp:Transcript_31846/g.51416  ORF Transcript_31846/g.51416 Transcript_31846/m.51416 type:complete len:89 (-) Transcript_31846:1469-1735(-)